MTKLVKALTVAAMLAVAMLATGAPASADPFEDAAPLPSNITWEE